MFLMFFYIIFSCLNLSKFVLIAFDNNKFYAVLNAFSVSFSVKQSLILSSNIWSAKKGPCTNFTLWICTQFCTIFQKENWFVLVKTVPEVQDFVG